MDQSQIFGAITIAVVGIITAIGFWVKSQFNMNVEVNQIEINQKKAMAESDTQIRNFAQDILVTDSKTLREYFNREMSLNREQLELANKVRESLIIEVATLKADVKQLGYLQARVDSMEKEIVELQERYEEVIEKNEQLVNQLNQTNLELSKKDRTILEKEIMIGNLQDEIKALNKIAQAKQEEINSLKQLIEALQEELNNDRAINSSNN